MGFEYFQRILIIFEEKKEMAVKITVHRGTDRIGGTITEIATENTHIFIDFGASLSDTDGKDSDDKMVNIINSAVQAGKCDAIFFTHFHGDHIGLLDRLPEKDILNGAIQLGMGANARKGLKIIHKTLVKFSGNEKHRNILKILNYGKWADFVDLEPNTVSFTINDDIAVTPISVDHSAFDSYMFIIEAEGKCIVHTGDFRTHGRLGKGFFERLARHLDDKSVDVLLTEGTMLSRLSAKLLTEEQMEQKAFEELNKPENKCAFLVCSSTNVESLASFHNAAMKLHRPFIVNGYVYEQLKLYRKTVGKSDKRLTFRKSYPFAPMGEYNPKLEMTQPEYMKKNGFVMMIGTNDRYTERTEYFREENPLLIYSMWGGYLDKDNPAYNPKLRELYDKWPRHLDLHTSGHAYKEDIEEMIRRVCPSKAIIPIHTEKKEMFPQLDIGQLSRLVKPAGDGDVYVI